MRYAQRHVHTVRVDESSRTEPGSEHQRAGQRYARIEQQFVVVPSQVHIRIQVHHAFTTVRMKDRMSFDALAILQILFQNAASRKIHQKSMEEEMFRECVF